MNLASAAGEPNRLMLFAGYNQDSTSVAVGTKDGYQLFLLNNIERLDRIYNNDAEKEICIMGRLFSSSLIAIVSLNAPRKLKVCHFKKGSEICSYSYTNSILAVKLNRQRLIVCLEESLYIHNIRDMKVVHTIKETAPNPAGICDLSFATDSSLLAYPGSSQSGHIEIFDTITLRSVISILAHDNPIASLAFNSSADKIATASEKGTVIRVFSVSTGDKLFEFRRGMKRSVHITSLSFSADSQYLCSSSNTETIHIFKLDAKADKSVSPTHQEESSSSWTGYVSSYLPSGVSNVFNQFRAFATCHLTVAGLRTVSTITNIHRVPCVVVISEDGLLQIFSLDPAEGGECKLLRTHRVDHIADESDTKPKTEGDRPLTDRSQSHSASGTASYTRSAARPTPPLTTTDSRSYQDLPTETSPPRKAVANLRLDDPDEFPPVSASPP